MHWETYQFPSRQTVAANGRFIVLLFHGSRRRAGQAWLCAAFSTSRKIGNTSASEFFILSWSQNSPDLAKAREIAARKGIGYQTLLKMLIHEGLQRDETQPER